MNLRTRFALAAAALVMAVLATSGAILFAVEHRHLVRQWQEREIDTALRFASVCREAGLDDNDLMIVNYARGLTEQPEVAYALFASPSGIALYHTSAELIGQPLDDPATRRSLDAPGLLVQSFRDPVWGPVADVSLPVTHGASRMGAARLGFKEDVIRKAVNDALWGAAHRWAAVGAACVVLGVAGAFALAGSLTRPLRLLEQGAQVIGEGRLEHRIPVGRPDEIGRVSERFNEMAAALAKLDEMKNGFVASVSHELRSPLAAIKSYVGVMLKGQTGALPEQTREYLTVVAQAADRLHGFINDILDLAKIEAGMASVTLEPVELAPLAREVATLFQPQAAQGGCAIEVRIPESLPPVHGDRERLRQVLTNLVANALKFTPEGGRVAVRAAAADGGVVCSVEDTGVGIPEEYLTRIFNKFEQARHPNQLRRAKGTGIGLTLAKGIVEAHGGRIWVESRVGEGSAFRFTLSAAPGGAAPRRTAP
jgi:histidine kinase